MGLRRGTKEMLSGGMGMISSKRVVTTVAFLLLVVTFVADLVFGRIVHQFVWEGFLYIVLAGMGLVAIEPAAQAVFRSPTNKSTPEVVEEEEEVPAGTEKVPNIREEI